MRTELFPYEIMQRLLALELLCLLSLLLVFQGILFSLVEQRTAFILWFGRQALFFVDSKRFNYEFIIASGQKPFTRNVSVNAHERLVTNERL